MKAKMRWRVCWECWERASSVLVVWCDVAPVVQAERVWQVDVVQWYMRVASDMLMGPAEGFGMVWRVGRANWVVLLCGCGIVDVVWRWTSRAART